MPSLFSRLKSKEGSKKSKKGAHADHQNLLPPKPRWEDAWTRSSVEPEEIHELVKRCTEEIKARALDLPFLLLPFRPTSDPSAVRTFVRHYFDNNGLRGSILAQEIRMTEPMVISGVIKWCWSRLQGGVVGWDAYELFKVGEQDSNMARDSFKTFIPLSVENGARSSIIFDFFDLLSAISAHGKMNGFGGRKLSRMASWWAFEHKDTGNGFDGGYKQWLKAADATSHLFFAYLRTLAPTQPQSGGISMLPMSLQKLLQETEYPPQRPALMQTSTNKVVMIVDTVSPTPFALLRRGNHFQYRDEDRALQAFSEYQDPVAALSEECRRVLRAIAAANQTQAVSSSKHSTSLRDASWSRFEDIGFGGPLDEEEDDEMAPVSALKRTGLRTTPASGANLGRPTTPSWADFLSSGFVDGGPNSPTNVLLPPDKILPPIDTTVRQRSAQSHRPRLESEREVEAGELASITRFDLDDSFWWVWMSSLAPEETSERKSAFGRCAVIETVIRSGRWIVMEEIVKGAAPEPPQGAYVAQKKSFFSWTRRSKDKDKSGVSRTKSSAGKNVLAKGDGHLKPSATLGSGLSKTSIGPDQQAKIQAAAQQLQARQERERRQAAQMQGIQRRGRTDADLMAEKTVSVMTLQPAIMSAASPAMKWANRYDKDAIREMYLANTSAGRGIGQSTMQTNGRGINGRGLSPIPPSKSPSLRPQPSPDMRAASPMTLPDESRLAERRAEAPSRFDDGEPNSPVPPPKDEPEPNSLDMVRNNMMSSESAGGSSPESAKKKKKLHKEEKKPAGGGFRRLFGRGRRASKLPENAAVDVNQMLSRQHSTRSSNQAPATPATPATPQKAEMPRQETQFATPREEPSDPMPSQTPQEPVLTEPAYEPSIHEEVTRTDTAEEREAQHEFSRFDQGPLVDQPAFAPVAGESESEDEAAPPPIARHKSPASPPAPSPEEPHPTIPEEEPHPAPPQEKPPAVPEGDRWAQIRKNAAARAAQRQNQEQSRGEHGRHAADGDDDASGEETIESRVARIKARVAELTGNMEGVQGPGASLRR